MPSTSRTTIIALVIALAFGAVVTAACAGVAVVLPAVQQAREAARRDAAKENLRQIGEALHQYEEREKARTTAGPSAHDPPDSR